VLGSNYDRIGERVLELPGITKAQARLPVEARGGVWREDRVANLFASTGRATARAVIQRALQPGSESFEDIWERYLDRARRSVKEADADELLEHGLPLLLRLSHGTTVRRSPSRDLQFTTTNGGALLGISICNQRNSRALAAKVEAAPSRQCSARRK
jgi:hypothetical protein